jgi:uncharacterized coiled-coil DUF342 family protein
MSGWDDAPELTGKMLYEATTGAGVVSGPLWVELDSWKQSMWDKAARDAEDSASRDGDEQSMSDALEEARENLDEAEDKVRSLENNLSDLESEMIELITNLLEQMPTASTDRDAVVRDAKAALERLSG